VDYTDHPDEVAEGVFAGLSFMEKFEVPANPNNIAVWYAYASGKYPDVRQAIDTLIAEKKPFTEEVCAEIYENYFSVERETQMVESASGRIVGELDRARDYVGQASENTQRIGDRLKTCSAQLADSELTKDVKGVLDKIIKETDAIGAETSALTSSLDEVADEVRTVIEAVAQEGESLTGETMRLSSQLEETVYEIREIERDFREQREEVLTDALTGTRNRKHFDIVLHSEIATAENESIPLSLIVIDLDHFSTFNASYGKAVGDQVLRLVARTMLECVKGQDTVGRIGGEEFAVLLPQTESGGAVKVAENIRAAFGRKTLTNRRTGEQYGTITLSAGVTQFQPGELSSQFLRRGDEAMIDAKEAGRDQIFTSS